MQFYFVLETQADGCGGGVPVKKKTLYFPWILNNFNLPLIIPKLNKMDLITIKHKGETVFSSEEPAVKKEMLNVIMEHDVTVTEVNVTSKTESFKATKIVMNELSILKILDTYYLLWLREGMEIYIPKK